MKNIYDELWNLPEDTLALSSDTNVRTVHDDAVTDDMNYLKNDGDNVSYSEIKYEEASDISQILSSNIDYGRYELSDSDRVLKDNVRFISLKYICRYLNRTAEWVADREILHNLFYVIDFNGDKLYREDEVVARMNYLNIEFRRKDLPYSEFNRTESAEYMGISQEEFEQIASEIPSKECQLETGESYSVFYRKDLDAAYRHHYFINIIAQSSESICPNDIRHILDIHGGDYEAFKEKYPLAMRKSHDTRVNLRHCSNDVKCYIEEHKGDKRIYKKTPQMISGDMARIYINAPRGEWLEILYKTKLLRPCRDANGNKIKNGYSSMFDIADLDWYIDKRECDDVYGLGREFITRKHIKNRYGVNDKWIDTFIKNSENVRIKVSTNEIVTWDYYNKNSLSLVIIGINYSDVEKVIKEGHYVDITHEYVRKRLGIDREENKKRYQQAKYSILSSHMAYLKSKRHSPFVYNGVDDDVIALTIESKINEERLILEEKRRLVEKISRERRLNDNKMRNILGLTERPVSGVTANECIRDMEHPQIFRCINKRGKCSVYKDIKLPYLTYDYVYGVNRYFTRGSTQKQSLSMKAFCSGMSHMITKKFRVTPSWFLYMDSTTYINDIFLKDKLAALPSEVGVVGAFGWTNIPKSYNWHESPSSYGMYDTYSIKNNTTKKIVGSCGFGETKEVDIIGGPVVAIRGELVNELLRMKYLHGYRVGDDHIGAVLSMYARMCRKKVCVIDTSFMSCSDYVEYVGGEEWEDDQIEFSMKWNTQLQRVTRIV